MFWVENDINTLRISFLQGLSLKAMARILDKSPGAVNKALTRFNIRPSKKIKCVWSLFPKKKPDSSLSSFVKKNPLQSLRTTASWRSNGSKMMNHKVDHHWVGLNEVIRFLHEQHESVTVIGHGKEAIYYINRRVASPSQLLLKANQLRCEQKLAPYCVDFLTH